MVYVVDGYGVGDENSYESKDDAIRSFENEPTSKRMIANSVDIVLYEATVDGVHKEEGTETTTNNGARVRSGSGTVVVTLQDKKVIGREVMKSESIDDYAIQDY